MVFWELKFSIALFGIDFLAKDTYVNVHSTDGAKYLSVCPPTSMLPGN